MIRSLQAGKLGPVLYLVFTLWLVSSCSLALPWQPLQEPVSVTAIPLDVSEPCANTFVPYILDHITTTDSAVVGLYESNGAGVAINDLDNDGDLDIVLANLADANTILWNQGDLAFVTQRLSHGSSRAVNIVDVEGDGLQDIVFTRRFAKPAYWHNTGQAAGARFIESPLPEVNNPFYSMAWGDVDRDGDLDLVGGSYDTELRKRQGGIFDYQGGGVGVFVHQRQGESYTAQRLVEQADALTILLPDLNNDGQLDILVGNDFVRPDYVWLHTANGWETASLFSTTTENTMSFDMGDINNDGSPELFATDMKPYAQNAQTKAAWQPLMQMMSHPETADDPQVAENVLQIRSPDGQFRNQAISSALDATGWSWSSKFGDLDNDGFLDVYVVNGMLADGILSHLPGNELVEENRALRNDGQGNFDLAANWGLGSTAGGRGMSMADLDSDGDLDIVINNLLTPALLFENRLCGGSGLEVDLRWPDSQNPYAIGAKLTLKSSTGTYYRDIRSTSGYLSGDPARVHFGLPSTAIPESLEIHWPDGKTSWVTELSPRTLLTVERNN